MATGANMLNIIIGKGVVPINLTGLISEGWVMMVKRVAIQFKGTLGKPPQVQARNHAEKCKAFEAPNQLVFPTVLRSY